MQAAVSRERSAPEAETLENIAILPSSSRCAMNCNEACAKSEDWKAYLSA